MRQTTNKHKGHAYACLCLPPSPLTNATTQFTPTHHSHTHTRTLHNTRQGAHPTPPHPTHRLALLRQPLLRAAHGLTQATAITAAAAAATTPAVAAHSGLPAVLLLRRCLLLLLLLPRFLLPAAGCSSSLTAAGLAAATAAAADVWGGGVQSLRPVQFAGGAAVRSHNLWRQRGRGECGGGGALGARVVRAPSVTVESEKAGCAFRFP